MDDSRRPIPALARSAVALLPFVVAFVAHLPALGAGFVWLDHAHVEHGLAIAEPRAFPELFARGFAETGFYRPLVALTLSIDAVFRVPWVFHLGNLLWHALTAQTLYAVARRLGSARGAALGAACVFAAHPATSVVADAIAFRSESMALLAILVAVLGAAASRPVVVAAACLLGALSKETALVLAPVFVVIHALAAAASERGTPFAERLLGRAPVLVGAASGLGAALFLRFSYAPPFRAAHVSLGWSEAIGMRLSSVARLAKAAVVPATPSVCDVVPIEGAVARTSIAGALVVVGLAWFVARQVRASRSGGRAPLAAVFLVAAIVPALQVVPVMRWWSIHYAYIPLAFALVVSADALSRLRPVSVNVKFGLAWTATVALSVVSIFEARRYHDDTSLFSREVDANAACREAQFYLGEVARAEGANLLAVERYEAALADRPGWLAYVDRSAATQNLGVALRNLGDLDGARRAFQDGLDHAPSESDRRALVHDLAAVTLEAGDAVSAFKLLEPEIQRADVASETLFVAASAARRLGFDATARQILDRLDQRGFTPGRTRP